MAISGSTITTPISVRDPYDLLGVPMRPEGYNLGYINSNAHSRINPFAKYKPIDYNKTGELTDSERGDKQWGTVIPNVDFTAFTNRKWVYNPPKGGDASPYRISDWIKYNHNAISPIELYFSASSAHTSTCAVDITLKEVDNSADFDRNTMMSILDGLRWDYRSVMRITLLLINNANKVIYSHSVDSKTLQQRINDNDYNFGISCPFSQFSIGNQCLALVCLTNNNPTTGATGAPSWNSGFSLEYTANSDRKVYNITGPAPAQPPFYATTITFEMDYINRDSENRYIYEIDNLKIDFTPGNGIPNYADLEIWAQCDNVDNTGEIFIYTYQYSPSQGKTFSISLRAYNMQNNSWHVYEQGVNRIYVGVFYKSGNVRRAIGDDYQEF